MYEENFAINYIPEPTGIKFHNDRDNYKYRFIRGVPGSGKSVICIMEALSWAMSQTPYKGVRYTRFAFVRATYPALKSTLIKSWKQWFPETIWPVKQALPFECTVKFSLADGTRVHMEVLFVAVETEEDVKKLKSFELTGGFVNEAFEVDRSVVTTLFERTGRYPKKDKTVGFNGPDRRGVWCDTNSPPAKHWWMMDEKNPPDGWKFYVQPAPLIRIRDKEGNTIRWDNNPDAENITNLSNGHDYYRDMLPGYTEDQKRVSIENLPGSIYHGKGVYDALFREDMLQPKLHLSTEVQVIIGIDTSGLNPAAAIMQEVMGHLAVFKEVIGDDIPFQQFCEEMLLPTIRDEFRVRSILAVVDHANPRNFMTGLTASQFLIGKGVKTVVAQTNDPQIRIDAVKHYMGLHQGFLVQEPECPNITEGLKGGYHYPKIKGKDTHSETPAKTHPISDIHDGIQYGALWLRRGHIRQSESSDAKAEKYRQRYVSTQQQTRRRLPLA